MKTEYKETKNNPNIPVYPILESVFFFKIKDEKSNPKPVIENIIKK